MPSFATTTTIELDNGLILKLTPRQPDDSSVYLVVDSTGGHAICAELTAADLQGLSDELLNALDQVA